MSSIRQANPVRRISTRKSALPTMNMQVDSENAARQEISFLHKNGGISQVQDRARKEKAGLASLLEGVAAFQLQKPAVVPDDQMNL